MEPYPIIEYAHKIGKNTTEFTLKDFAGFMKWWLKLPIWRGLVEGTPEQKEQYKRDLEAMNKWRKDETVNKNQKYQQAMQSRCIQPPDEVVEEVESEIVAELGLTQQDVDALAWGIKTLLETFDFSELSEVEESLTNLGQALESLVTQGE